MDNHCLLPHLDKTPKNDLKMRNTQMILQSYQDMKTGKGISFFQSHNKGNTHSKSNQRLLNRFKNIYKLYSIGQRNNYNKEKKSSTNIAQLDQSKTLNNDNPKFKPYIHYSRNYYKEMNIDSKTSLMQGNSSHKLDNSLSKNNTSTLHLRTFSVIDQPILPNCNRTYKKNHTKNNEIQRQLLSGTSKDLGKYKLYFKRSNKNDFSTTNYLQTTDSNMNNSNNIHQIKSELTLSPHHSKSLSFNTQSLNQFNKSIKSEINQFSTGSPIIIRNLKLKSTKVSFEKDDIKDSKIKIKAFKEIEKQKEENNFEQLQNDIISNFSCSSSESLSQNKDEGLETDHKETSKCFSIKESEIQCSYESNLTRVLLSKYKKSDTQDTYYSSIHSDAKKNNSFSSDSLNLLSLKPKNKKQSKLRHYQSQLSKISETSKSKLFQDKTMKLEQIELRLSKSDVNLFEHRIPIELRIKKAKTLTKPSNSSFLNQYIKESSNNILKESGILLNKKKSISNKTEGRNSVFKTMKSNKSWKTNKAKVKEKINHYKRLYSNKQRVKALELFLNQYSAYNDSNDLVIQNKCFNAKSSLLQQAIQSLSIKRSKPRYKKRPYNYTYHNVYSDEDIYQNEKPNLFETGLIESYTSFDHLFNLNQHHNTNHLINNYFDVDVPLKVLKHMYCLEDFELDGIVTLFVNFKSVKSQRLTRKITKRKRINEFLKLIPLCGELTYASLVFYNQFLVYDNVNTEQFNDFSKDMRKSLLIIRASTFIHKGNKSLTPKKIKIRSVYSKTKNNCNLSSHKECGFSHIVDRKKDTLNLLEMKLKSKSTNHDFSDTILNSRFLKRKKTKRHNKREINGFDQKLKTKISLLNYPSQLINLELVKTKKKQFNSFKYHKMIDKNDAINKAIEVKNTMLHALHSYYDTIQFHIKDHNFIKFKEVFEHYKIDKETKDKNGNSMLNLAVQSNSIQIANYLLDEGANPNSKNNISNTPLHYALIFHYYEIADMLINSGANENIVNLKGLTPWQCVDSCNAIN